MPTRGCVTFVKQPQPLRFCQAGLKDSDRKLLSYPTPHLNKQESMKTPALKVCVLLLATWFWSGAPEAAFGADGPVTLTSQPVSQRIYIGDPVTFSVGVDGTSPFFYQWLRDGTAIPLATGGSYTLGSTVATDDSARFSVVVSNSFSAATSQVAILTIDPGIFASNAVTLVPINATWRYNQSGANLGTAWKDVGFDDTVAGWQSGPGAFDAKYTSGAYVTRPVAGETVGTQLVLGNPPATADTTNYYLRTHFNYSTSNVIGASLFLRLILDDGAAVYLNGQEIQRTGVDPGATAATWANRTVGDPAYEDFEVPATALINGDNVLAAEVHQVNATSSDITFGCVLQANVVTRMRDTVAPTASYLPVAGSTVRSLPQIEVRFSEAVQGVDAADLLINNVPATQLLLYASDQYVFRFPAPPTGVVQVAWASGHGIVDLSVNSNAFAGGSFTYILDPNASSGDIRINEFLAANRTGLADEDGDREDWLELFNGGTAAADLAGWYLTDDPLNLQKWQFPSVSLPAGGYLIVWASEKNRRVPGSPLHTNFKLANNGEYLALVLPDGSSVVSSYSPTYPAQFDDISYGRDRIDPALLTYFSTPTPGVLNSATGAGLGVGPEVRFSRKSGTFRTGFSLELSVSDTNFVVRYFVVNSAATATSNNVPSATSPAYSGPIPISVTTQIRARAYPTTPGYYPGPASSETYLQIDAGAAGFTSDLPVIIFHDFAAGIPPSSRPYAIGVVMVFDTNNPTALTSLTNAPVLTARIGSHVRGSSTETFAKRNLAIETWTEVNYEDKDVELLGMPADADWVLYAPNQFDRNYLHNPVAYALGRQMGHYASRTRFAEFFFNTAGGVVTYNPASIASGNYNGIYVVEEKIKVNKNRLDIARLDPQDTNAVTITGGYIMKIDRNNDTDDVNYFTPGNWSSTTFPWITANHAGWNTQPVIFHDPDGTMIGTRPLQRNWFISYINAFEAALTSPSNWTNPVSGYRAYIDEDQWIENHMLNIIPFNVDGYRLSGYFYKERDEAGLPGSGKLKQGPAWDYDRTQGTGNVDPRPFNPRQWKRPIAGDQGTDLFGNNDNTTGTRLGVRWWWQMFHDPDFWQRWVDRWQDLRDTPLWTTTNILALINSTGSSKNAPPPSWNTTNVLALIDALANQVRQAQPRNAARWTSGDSIGTPNTGTHSADGYSYTFDGTYQGDVNFMKKWWSDRLDFVETNFLRRPVLSSAGGLVPTGYVVTVTVPNAKPGTVTYYTLDGTDPRLPGGAIASGVLSNTAPFNVTITQNTRLFARNRNPDHSNVTNASLIAIGGNPPISTPWSGTAIATYVVATPPLRISEIMYHPPGLGVVNDTNDPGNFEYLELVNVSGSPLSLIGFRFTNGIDFTFTATNSVTSLAAGGRVLVVKNRAFFLSRYPTLASQIAGEFRGNLDNAGERIALIGPLWEPILDFRYENTTYPATDGRGFSLVPVDENAPLNTWTNETQWRASAYDGGSPGALDPVPASLLPVIVNEILTATVPENDAIELWNPNATPVDISYWYLTDNRDIPKKYRIPATTVIPAFGYVVFYETNSFGNTNAALIPFGLSSVGEEAYLFSGDSAGRLTGYIQGFDFGPASPNVTFGRYVNSVGQTLEVAQSAGTLGATNAYPLVGPVVINEVMYHPPDLFISGAPAENYRDEFIELRNISGAEVPLYDPSSPVNRWQIQQAVEFKFPIGASLPPNGYLLVVSFDPVREPASLDSFRARYGLSDSVPIYGPYEGHLANEGERLELRKPGVVNPSTGLAPMVLVDRLDYTSTNPWPVTASGTGASLQRQGASAFGNDPANWLAAGPSAGGERVSGTPPTITAQPQPLTVPEESTATFTVSVDGTGPFTFQWFYNGIALDGAYGASLVLGNVQLNQAGSYTVLILSGSGTVLSSAASLTVRQIPVILQQPTSTNITLTSTSVVNFGVSAVGNGALSYQWQFQADTDPDYANLLGATASTLVVSNIQVTLSGGYRVLVTDSIGTRASLPGYLRIRPFLAQQPAPVNQTVAVGTEATMRVEAFGTQPMNFRWRRYGATFASTGLGTLTLTNVVLTNAGRYDVVVTNLAGNAPNSSSAYLVVVAPPTNQVVSPGSNVTLRAILGSPGPFTNRFWWLFNDTSVVKEGTNIAAGSTTVVFTNDLVLTNLQAGELGNYTFLLSNAVTTTSGVFTVTRAFTARVAFVDTNVPITLAIELQGTNAVIRWNDSPATWTLEEATDLTPPPNWGSSGATPVLGGGRWEAVVPVAEQTNKFFRLRRP